jgi:hypothetical protein
MAADVRSVKTGSIAMMFSPGGGSDFCHSLPYLFVIEIMSQKSWMERLGRMVKEAFRKDWNLFFGLDSGASS